MDWRSVSSAAFVRDVLPIFNEFFLNIVIMAVEMEDG